MSEKVYCAKMISCLQKPENLKCKLLLQQLKNQDKHFSHDSERTVWPESKKT